MAEGVVLVDPLGVQGLVILKADGRAVPGDVDPRMRVEEELRLLGGDAPLATALKKRVPKSRTSSTVIIDYASPACSSLPLMGRESRSKSATGGVSILELKTTPHPTGSRRSTSPRGGGIKTNQS